MENTPHQTLSSGPAIRVDGRYARGKLIGRGGSGSVYEATQLSVNRKVALKVLNPRHRDETYQVRFKREAHAVASLNHPNIVTLFDYGYDEDLNYLYMAMEFAEGATLASTLRERTLTIADVVRYGASIAHGLAHAHKAGVLHRDLKPGNVIVTADDEVKILDFGMAGLMGVDRNKRITRQGAIYGTPPYMSPEQCHGDLNVTPASDLYSFGIMLFEMIEGRLPFNSANVVDILVQHTTEEAPPVTNPGAPKALVELVRKLLLKEPCDRVQSAKEVAQILDDMFVPEPGRAPMSTPRGGVGPDTIPPEYDDGPETIRESRPPEIPTPEIQNPETPRLGVRFDSDVIKDAQAAPVVETLAPMPSEVSVDPAEVEFSRKSRLAWVLFAVGLVGIGAIAVAAAGSAPETAPVAETKVEAAPSIPEPVTPDPAKELATAIDKSEANVFRSIDAAIVQSTSAASEVKKRPVNKVAKKSTKAKKPNRAAAKPEKNENPSDRLKTIKFTY